MSLITKRIDEAPYGTAFVVSDFTDLAEYETSKKTHARLETKGSLLRVMRGVYDKPQFSTILNEYAAPDPDQIAHAIARNYNQTISASGNTAFNLLGTVMLERELPSPSSAEEARRIAEEKADEPDFKYSIGRLVPVDIDTDDYRKKHDTRAV